MASSEEDTLEMMEIEGMDMQECELSDIKKTSTLKELVQCKPEEHPSWLWVMDFVHASAKPELPEMICTPKKWQKYCVQTRSAIQMYVIL